MMRLAGIRMIKQVRRSASEILTLHGRRPLSSSSREMRSITTTQCCVSPCSGLLPAKLITVSMIISSFSASKLNTISSTSCSSMRLSSSTLFSSTRGLMSTMARPPLKNLTVSRTQQRFCTKSLKKKALDINPYRKPDTTKKRARQSRKRRVYNRALKSQVKKQVNKVLEALDNLVKSGGEAAQPPEEVVDQLIAEAYAVIDKAVRVGTLHRNTGARRKSRLARTKNAALRI